MGVTLSEYMENLHALEEKANLMKHIKLINNASKESIELMHNLKFIERLLKCLKDFNPLVSMMALISIKYPLRVDKERAYLFDMLNSFFPKGKIDTHQHGRIFCRKKVIERWINKTYP